MNMDPISARHPGAGRRNALRLLGGLALAMAAGVLRPVMALAAEWNKAAFDAKALPEALKALGIAAAADSDKIDLKAPEIAENGAIVPIEVGSALPNTQSIYIFAEKNPQPLVAQFDLTGIEPFISTRIKMGESAKVRVIVKADGKFYSASREVKVTIGGCGG
jgi:sulfur-oxidizing protein SoxY